MAQELDFWRISKEADGSLFMEHKAGAIVHLGPELTNAVFDFIVNGEQPQVWDEWHITVDEDWGGLSFERKYSGGGYSYYGITAKALSALTEWRDENPSVFPPVTPSVVEEAAPVDLLVLNEEGLTQNQVAYFETLAKLDPENTMQHVTRQAKRKLRADNLKENRERANR